MEAEERARGPSPQHPDPGTTAPEPPDERPAGGGAVSNGMLHERCVHHPGRPAVARCSACEEPVCMACAVPVRGRVLGPECLAAELGDPAITTPPEPDRTLVGSWVAVAGAALALLATAGPWTKTGAGDRMFGAWVPSFRWSMGAALAAGILLPAVWWFHHHEARSGATVAIVGGTAIAAVSALAIAFPPTFQVASWGPWVAVVGGTIAAAGGIANVVMGARPGQGV
ncbi:MAG TPA: B-box zinc finger protein [Actinomycetota bacterium]|nr:B-box zinc finger protein [Actinomycetota bacterium]